MVWTIGVEGIVPSCVRDYLTVGIGHSVKAVAMENLYHSPYNRNA